MSESDAEYPTSEVLDRLEQHAIQANKRIGAGRQVGVSPEDLLALVAAARDLKAVRERLTAAAQDDNISAVYGGCGDDCEWKALGWAAKVAANGGGDE